MSPSGLNQSTSDLTFNHNQATVDAVVSTLKEIEAVAPSKESYSNLCLLLTVNKLSDHPEYRSWNPSKGRVDCFRSGHYYLIYIFL